MLWKNTIDDSLGAIHADKNLVDAQRQGQLDAETLALLNQQYIMFGEPGLFQQSDWVFEFLDELFHSTFLPG